MDIDYRGAIHAGRAGDADGQSLLHGLRLAAGI
jgi:hypothetical protein